MKKIVLGLIVFMISFMFVSCNDTSTTTTDDTSSNTETTMKEINNLRDSYYQYSKNSTQNIKILHLDITEDFYITNLDGDILSNDDIIVKNDYYEIKSDYLLGLGVDDIDFYLYFGNYRTLISITLNDKDEPYMISSAIAYTDGTKDLMFQFEIFDGIVSQISNASLTSSDYELNDNLLTVKKEYLDDMFDITDEISINYALDADSLVIGLINIYRELS